MPGPPETATRDDFKWEPGLMTTTFSNQDSCMGQPASLVSKAFGRQFCFKFTAVERNYPANQEASGSKRERDVRKALLAVPLRLQEACKPLLGGQVPALPLAPQNPPSRTLGHGSRVSWPQLAVRVVLFGRRHDQGCKTHWHAKSIPA